jgi:hypothetical protein
MTALEMKASLINSIEGINDESVINRISRYVSKLIKEAKKNRISREDLVIDPEVESWLKGIKGGSAIDDKEAMHRHWEEKYK